MLRPAAGPAKKTKPTIIAVLLPTAKDAGNSRNPAKQMRNFFCSHVKLEIVPPRLLIHKHIFEVFIVRIPLMPVGSILNAVTNSKKIKKSG